MTEKQDNPIAQNEERGLLHTTTIKAGSRLYYIDVKSDRNNEIYLAITESKKRAQATAAGGVMYEKHKIFLYHEDFDKFRAALSEAFDHAERYITSNDTSSMPPSSSSDNPESVTPINLDIDF